MAKKNSGDILSCDWNPVIGCERSSVGCARCWYLDSIFPWQRRLGNIPAGVGPSEHYLFEKRLTAVAIRAKRGIDGVVLHGALFGDQVPDAAIDRVLSVVDEGGPVASGGGSGGRDAGTKFLLWTKRAERMADILSRRYPAASLHT